MENILVNFDLESKKEIQELVNKNKKFNQLMKKLQIAKNAIGNEIKPSILTQKTQK